MMTRDGKQQSFFLFFESSGGPEGGRTREKKKERRQLAECPFNMRPHGLHTQFFYLRKSCSHREGLKGEECIMKAPCDSRWDKEGAFH